MFERFTDGARRVLVYAQEEARRLDHANVGTEHVLLGLIRERPSVAADALETLGVRLESARREVEELVPRGPGTPPGHVPLTPRTKKVLELTLREALQLGHDHVGQEHILLALVREGDGVGAQVLVKQGVALTEARQEVIRRLVDHVQPEETGENPDMQAEPIAGWTNHAPWPPGRLVPFPACVRCGGDLRETAAYRSMPVKSEEGDTPREVLFVFCRTCGATFTAHVVPPPGEASS